MKPLTQDEVMMLLGAKDLEIAMLRKRILELTPNSKVPMEASKEPNVKPDDD